MKILGVIGVIGAAIMIFAGVDMTRIVSQSAAEGGTRSVAEVFYNAMGWGFIGIGIFCIMLICVVAFREVHLTEGDEEEEEEERNNEKEDGEEEHDEEEEKQTSKKKRLTNILDRLTET